jgi:hypothetical protein
MWKESTTKSSKKSGNQGAAKTLLLKYPGIRRPEAGYLRLASILAMEAGADFINIHGKQQPAAPGGCLGDVPCIRLPHHDRPARLASKPPVVLLRVMSRSVLLLG